MSTAQQQTIKPRRRIPLPIDDDALLSASEARKLAGGITSMTEWRWRRAGLLPEPIKIRRRAYYKRSAFMHALRNLGDDS